MGSKKRIIVTGGRREGAPLLGGRRALLPEGEVQLLEGREALLTGGYHCQEKEGHCCWGKGGHCCREGGNTVAEGKRGIVVREKGGIIDTIWVFLLLKDLKAVKMYVNGIEQMECNVFEFAIWLWIVLKQGCCHLPFLWHIVGLFLLTLGASR